MTEHATTTNSTNSGRGQEWLAATPRFILSTFLLIFPMLSCYEDITYFRLGGGNVPFFVYACTFFLRVWDTLIMLIV